MPASVSLPSSPAAPAIRGVPLSIGIVLAVAATSLAWGLLWHFDHSVSSEGRLMEWGQAAFLIAAAGVLFLRLRSRPALEDRLAWWGLALFFLSLASREIEMRVLSRMPVLLITERGFRWALGIAWVWYGFRAVPRWPEMLRYARPFFTSRTGVLFLGGAVLYLISWFFDRHHWIELFKRQFIEELIEFHATFLMLVASLLAGHLMPHGDAVTPSEPA